MVDDTNNSSGIIYINGKPNGSSGIIYINGKPKGSSGIIYAKGKSSSGTIYLDISGVNAKIEKQVAKNTEDIEDLQEVTANHEVRITDLENGGSFDKNYVYEQEVASDTWVINHNLGKFPSVEIVDSAGTRMYPEVQWVDDNNCIARMNAAVKGKAYLN